MSTNIGVLCKSKKEYRRRKPEYSPYCQCIEDYYEQFKRSYDRNFSQKYGYLRPHIEKVTYQSKYGKDIKEFSCLEWMAALVSHIPDRGGQTVRYYGFYSNATRGRLKKEEDEPQFH